MSKTLIFADSTSITVEDISSISNIVVTAADFSAIQAIYAKFTEDNLKHVTLDGTVYTGIKKIAATAVATDANVTMTVSCRTVSFEENITNQITELQEAVAELAAGGNA